MDTHPLSYSERNKYFYPHPQPDKFSHGYLHRYASLRGPSHQPTAVTAWPPAENDTTFVRGDGNPTACTFQGGSSLFIPLQVDRYVGEVNGDGRLQNPSLLIDNHVVSAQARLLIAAFDVDSNAASSSHQEPEVDE